MPLDRDHPGPQPATRSPVPDAAAPHVDPDAPLQAAGAHAGEPAGTHARAVRAAARASADAAWRDAILAAAEAEFTERGYAAARILDIARRAGLSVGGLYRHFDSKEALFASLMERADGAIGERLVAAAAGAPEPGLRVRRLIETLLAFIEENRAMFMVFQQLPASGALAARSETTRTRVLAALRDALRDGVAAGALRGDVGLDDQLVYVTGALQGFLDRWARSGAGYRLSGEAGLIAELSLRALAAEARS